MSERLFILPTNHTTVRGVSAVRQAFSGKSAEGGRGALRWVGIKVDSKPHMYLLDSVLAGELNMWVADRCFSNLPYLLCLCNGDGDPLVAIEDTRISVYSTPSVNVHIGTMAPRKLVVRVMQRLNQTIYTVISERHHGIVTAIVAPQAIRVWPIANGGDVNLGDMQATCSVSVNDDMYNCYCDTSGNFLCVAILRLGADRCVADVIHTIVDVYGISRVGVLTTVITSRIQQRPNAGNCWETDVEMYVDMVREIGVRAERPMELELCDPVYYSGWLYRMCDIQRILSAIPVMHCVKMSRVRGVDLMAWQHAPSITEKEACVIAGKLAGSSVVRPMGSRSETLHGAAGMLLHVMRAVGLMDDLTWLGVVDAVYENSDTVSYYIT